jgi:hypothetical protein
MNNTKLNKYEIEILKSLELEYDGYVYKGFDLLYAIALGIGQGNYTLYNLATGGAGPQYSPVANLLAKLGVE